MQFWITKGDRFCFRLMGHLFL